MKKNIAIYPGTFDPVTNGHLDILSRACRIFDLVIVAMAEKSPKSTILTLSERLDLFETVLKKRLFDCPVKVMAFQGLLINFAKKQNAQTLVRGLRAISDFEYEFQMALMNRHQAPDIETVFLMPDEKYVYLSSSIVKEIARLKGNLKNFLPPEVLTALKNKY
jgi:pantetheine-phosphate adenylyltransferase